MRNTGLLKMFLVFLLYTTLVAVGCFFIFRDHVVAVYKVFYPPSMITVTGQIPLEAGQTIVPELSFFYEAGEEWLTAPVSGSGRFEFELAESTLGVLYTNDGGRSCAIPVDSNHRKFWKLDLGRLAMQKSETVSGRVVDLSGEPIAGATVSIVYIHPFIYFGDAFPAASQIEKNPLSAKTSADGVFELSGLSADLPVYLNVTADGFYTNSLLKLALPMTMRNLEIGLERISEPGQAAAPQAAQLRVVDQQNQVVPAVTCVVRSRLNRSWRAPEAFAQGEDGTYRLEWGGAAETALLTAPGFLPYWVNPAALKSGSQQTVVMHPAAALHAQLASNARIGSLVLRRDATSELVHVKHRTQSSRLNRAEIEGLTPGTYHLTLVGDDHTTPFGQRRREMQTLVLKPGDNEFDVSFSADVLEPPASAQDLTVMLRLEGAPKRTVFLPVARNQFGQRVEGQWTPEEHRWRFDGLAPGKWIFVLDPVFSGVYIEKRVHLSDQEDPGEVVLEYKPEKSLSFRATLDGRPLVNMAVAVYHVQKPRIAMQWTGIDGVVVFNNLGQGRYCVIVSDKEEEGAMVRTFVDWDGEQDIALDLAYDGDSPSGVRAAVSKTRLWP